MSRKRRICCLADGPRCRPAEKGRCDPSPLEGRTVSASRQNPFGSAEAGDAEAASWRAGHCRSIPWASRSSRQTPARGALRAARRRDTGMTHALSAASVPRRALRCGWGRCLAGPAILDGRAGWPRGWRSWSCSFGVHGRHAFCRAASLRIYAPLATGVALLLRFARRAWPYAAIRRRMPSSAAAKVPRRVQLLRRRCLLEGSRRLRRLCARCEIFVGGGAFGPRRQEIWASLTGSSRSTR